MVPTGNSNNNHDHGMSCENGNSGSRKSYYDKKSSLEDPAEYSDEYIRDEDIALQQDLCKLVRPVVDDGFMTVVGELTKAV